MPEPDEKSVITYISSLYDVFPDVPSVEETLRDNVRYIIQISLSYVNKSYTTNQLIFVRMNISGDLGGPRNMNEDFSL